MAGAHSLPADLLRRCLEPLDHRSLLAAAGTSREWREAALCESLWRSRYAADFARSAGSRSGSSTLGCPAARLYPEAEPGASSAGASPGGWRQAYKERAEVENNWQRGRCSSVHLRGHRDYIRCAQLGPGGATLATCSGSYMHRDCSIRLWDVSSGQCSEHLRGHQGPIWSMQYDGARLASCCDEGIVRLWDLGSHRVGVASALQDCSLRCLGMDERQLVVGGESGLLALWPLDGIHRTLEESDELPLPEQEEEADGEDGEGGGFPAWQEVALEAGAAGVQPALARSPHQSPALSPAISCLQVDGRLCASGESSRSQGFVQLWNTEGDELRHRAQLAGHRGGVSTLSFQHSTGWLVAGSGVGAIWLWDLASAQAVRELRGHTGYVLCHQQSGALLASGSADRTVRLWDLRCGEGGAQHKVPLDSFPYSLQMDDRRLVAGCANGMVQFVDLRCLHTAKGGSGGAAKPTVLPAYTMLPAHRERVWALALSETRLISASLDASVVVRSFRPEDVESWEASSVRSGRRGNDHGLSSSGSDDELDSAYDSEHSEGEEEEEADGEEEEELEDGEASEEEGSDGSASEREDGDREDHEDAA
ncbi:hypothetical protein ABPG75_012661 [Micractinium tetrahymenae]